MPETKTKSFDQISLRTDLGTRKLIDECAAMIHPDQYGRPIPTYAVVHRAALELRDRLRAEKEPR